MPFEVLGRQILEGYSGSPPAGTARRLFCINARCDQETARGEGVTFNNVRKNVTAVQQHSYETQLHMARDMLGESLYEDFMATNAHDSSSLRSWLCTPATVCGTV